VKVRVGKQFPDWQAKGQRYIDSRNKDGYLRYMRSIYQQVLPGAVADAVAKVVKTAAPVRTTPGQPVKKTPPAAAVPSGFAPVAKEPSTWDIDWDRTDTSMLRRNRAVLKDGKKVTWK
jgi:hypothetical protein